MDILNKEYCIKCCNAYSKWKIVNKMNALRWGIHDESRWKKETVICPPEYRGTADKPVRKITDKPPTNCPFLLEHILTNQESK